MTDIITIKNITGSPKINQPVFQSKGQSGLTRAAQPGEPDGNRLLPEQERAVSSCYMACVPDNMAIFHDMESEIFTTLGRRQGNYRIKSKRSDEVMKE